jgi:hypothetical protein
MPTSAADEVMMDEDATSSWTAIVFAIVSLIGYWLFLKPTTAGANAATTAAAATTTTTATTATTTNNNNNNNNNTRQVRQPPQQQAAPRRQPVPAERRNPTPHLSDAALELLLDCQSKPAFVQTETEKVGIGGHKTLVDGLVAFSHTQAAAAASSSSMTTTTMTMMNTTTSSTETLSRTERAKILSRLATAPGMTLTTPPGKGSTLVVSLPSFEDNNSSSNNSNSNSQLPHILHVLGTYYTLIIVIGTSLTTNLSSIKEQETYRQRMQEKLFATGELTESILPKHRILMASTKTGRIALVRQLARVELVVDFEVDVQTELGRFGYKVAVIPKLSNLLDE